MNLSLAFHFVKGMTNREKKAHWEKVGPYLMNRPPQFSSNSWQNMWDVARELAEKEIQHAHREGYEILTIDDPQYPSMLRDIQDPPMALMGRGLWPTHLLPLGIVGTRKPTLYGVKAVRELFVHLSSWPVLPVSGLAFGIDAEVHAQSVLYEMPNVAFLAGGMGYFSPKAHLTLAGQMLEGGGGYFTEQPFSQPSLPQSYPVRNRLIAGATEALVLVESAKKSGALITANMSANYERTVFAVPGPWNAPMSQGPNTLLDEGLAHVLTRFDSFPEKLRAQWSEPIHQKGVSKDLELQVLRCFAHGRRLNSRVISTTLGQSNRLIESALEFLCKEDMLERHDGLWFTRKSI